MADGSSVCARPAAGRRPGIVALPAKGGIGAVRAWPGRTRPGTDGPAWSSLPGSPVSARQRVFQSRKTKARPVPASGPRGRGCVPDVPAPVRTAGSSAAAPVDQEGGHGERHEDAPWAVPAMAEVVPEAATLPRPGGLALLVIAIRRCARWRCSDMKQRLPDLLERRANQGPAPASPHRQSRATPGAAFGPSGVRPWRRSSPVRFCWSLGVG